MRTHILRKLSLLLGSAVGAVNCHEYEYGVPVGTFSISGTVVDAATSEGIRGIEVTYQDEVTTSEANGAWTIRSFPDQVCEGIGCVVTATDIDGDTNGSYDDAEASFHPEQIGEADGAYDEGSWEATDVLVEMEPTHRDTGS